MQRVKVLVVKFDRNLTGLEIPKFRSAVIEKITEPDILFHHHKNDDKVLYKYPLIQYKTINRKAAIFCIDKGIEAVNQFLSLDNWNMRIGKEITDISVESVKANQFTIQAWDKYFYYRINSWLALNEKNYAAYKELKKEGEKLFFLENILRGNILSFGKGINCKFEKEVKVNITDISREKTKLFKDIKMHAIDATFKTNVFLPNYLGLGKGVSIGFGTIFTIRK